MQTELSTPTDEFHIYNRAGDRLATDGAWTRRADRARQFPDWQSARTCMEQHWSDVERRRGGIHVARA